MNKLELKYIKIVPIVYSGTDKSQIDNWFNYANNQGWEGLMINRDMVYSYTRTKALLKIKKFDTLDLKIVGYTQGTGKYEHTLGALACKFRDNVVYVGTGFDDLTRDLLWEQRDHLEGKLCEVKYKDITYDKHTSLPSLQFPVFVCIKEDKVKADA
jgi:DNA ligase-1